ncbi:MAG TPA: helix-turn-helix domain-containing protein [Candidatus Limnocylindria bacterium]|nr:helix-turn-helix domain-containing protein [Candidatus Limnocylindria bacterium]
MGRGRYTRKRRTSGQSLADERVAQLARALGRSLRDARLAARRTQREAAMDAGIAQSTWSAMERALAATLSLRVWMRATHAVGADLHAYLDQVSAAQRPRDSVHLRHQELLASVASEGGWRVRPEAETGSGFADLVLARPGDAALIEIWDWVPDVGDAFRSWRRKREHLEASHVTEDDVRVSGLWVLRGTRRNRTLLRDHPALFRAQFPGSGAAWLGALSDPSRPMPLEPAILWVSVDGRRLWPARL